MLYLSNTEWAIKIGEDIRLLRLLKNLPRGSLCALAGISETALGHLEGGKGATLKTLIAVLVALGKQDWMERLRPEISINPLRRNRVRASSQKSIEAALREQVPRRIQQSLKKYGLSLEDYAYILDRQNNKCGNESCLTVFDITSRSPCVDHDHITGKVRSLLCSGCSTALGMLKENESGIAGLADYAKKFKPK